MNRFLRSLLYALTITAVLLTSVLGTTTVYADGGTTEDPPAAETPADPPEEPAADEVIADPDSEDPSDEASADENVSVPEILEQVPEGTELVIVNEVGESEPLVSQEAAEILIEGDPVWCPDGQAPTPGANGCTAGHAGFDDLIADLTIGTYSGDGVIWVESTYDANEDTGVILFDGTSGNLAALSAISVLGGWNGVSGSSTLDASSPSLLDDSLTFTNWSGAVSISNLDFQTANNVNGSLIVDTDGDITLNNVSIDDNQDGAGATLDNCLDTGSACAGSGDVTVLESSFTNNDGTGLDVVSSGNMTVQHVTVENNDYGIVLDTDYGNANDVKIKDATISNNANDGIHIYDVDGDVILKDITATDNNDGIEVDDTYGNVYGSNITSNGGMNDGVDIDNANGNVTFTNVNASDNGGNGFEISNVDGDIYLVCVEALNNGQDGVYVTTNGGVTVKCSTITGNADDGVDIDLAPTAQLLSVSSSGNGDLDVEVNPTTTLTVKNVDCNPKKKTTSSGDKGLYTKLYCLPGEIKVALYDTYGDNVEFTNLCGYEAGVFDPNSGAFPKAIPGGGDEYITSLHEKVVESLPNLVPDTEHGLPGIYAQVLDELPYVLPDGFSYSSAFFTVVLEEGEYMDPLPEDSSLTIRFQVPESLDDDEKLTILWWDGMDWVDMGGEYSEGGYYFQITTEEIGVFVLAVQEVEL